MLPVPSSIAMSQSFNLFIHFPCPAVSACACVSSGKSSSARQKTRGSHETTRDDDGTIFGILGATGAMFILADQHLSVIPSFGKAVFLWCGRWKWWPAAQTYTKCSICGGLAPICGCQSDGAQSGWAPTSQAMFSGRSDTVRDCTTTPGPLTRSLWKSTTLLSMSQD